MIQPLWRTVWRFLKKLKIELPYDSAIPLLGIYPEKTIMQLYFSGRILWAILLESTILWNQQVHTRPFTRVDQPWGSLIRVKFLMYH